MKLMIPGVTLAALVVLAGCMNERTYVDPTSHLKDGDTQKMNVTGGALRGDFGTRRGFDGPATELSGTSDLDFRTSTVTVSRAEQERGTGMVILWTNGRLLSELAPGEHTFAYDPQSLDAAEIEARVCSGEDGSSIDYDAPADRGTVLVQQTPEGTQIDVSTETAILDDTGTPTGNFEQASSSFVVSRE